jgi:hypothetical protein
VFHSCKTTAACASCWDVYRRSLAGLGFRWGSGASCVGGAAPRSAIWSGRSRCDYRGRMSENDDILGDLQRQADAIAPEGLWVPTPDEASEQQAMEKVKQQLLDAGYHEVPDDEARRIVRHAWSKKYDAPSSGAVGAAPTD